MKTKCVVLLLGAVLFFCADASADQDFYGIKMKDEVWAKNLVLHTGAKADPAELQGGPVLDSAIFADAVIKELPPDRMDLRINVVNGRGEAIPADYEYRDFFLHLKDGRRIPLIDPEAQWKIGIVKAKSSATFNPSLGNLVPQTENIRMIECSFDLGRTKIFLFPSSMKSVVNKLKNPEYVPASEPQAPEKTKPSKTIRPKSRLESPSKSPSSPSPRRTKPPVQSFMEWMGFSTPKKEAPAKASNPAVEPRTTPIKSVAAEPVKEPAAVSDSTQKKLDKAIQNFKYVPTNEEVAAADLSQEQRSEAHVIDYNKAYNFITMNLGSRDGLKKNMTVSVMRNGKTVARAKVKQLRDGVSAALVLSDARRTDIRPGDLISVV